MEGGNIDTVRVFQCLPIKGMKEIEVLVNSGLRIFWLQSNKLELSCVE